MAKTDLIKGIDNTCEAVVRAVKRAQATGFAGRTRPPLKGIDNADVKPIRMRTTFPTASGDLAAPPSEEPSIRGW